MIIPPLALSSSDTPAMRSTGHVNTQSSPSLSAAPTISTTTKVKLIAAPIAGIYADAGPMENLYFLIFQSPCVVGRDQDVHCSLPPGGARSDVKISRRHMHLARLDDHQWELQCLSSQTVEVDGHVLHSGDRIVIADQDLILIGSSVLIFRCSDEWREQFTPVADHAHVPRHE